MKQTENTAIVLRFANYRDNDRMLTLLSREATEGPSRIWSYL